MVGLSYASVPLYDLFCRTTGYGGTVQKATESVNVVNSNINIRFNSDVSGSLKWYFQPIKRNITTKLGKNEIIFYKATNNSDVPIVGTSTFNVTPQKAGIYFNKLDCFCYEEQYLAPGESAELPVNFFISPDIANDPNTKDIKTITLSYMFFDAGEKVLEKYTNHNKSNQMVYKKLKNKKLENNYVKY